MDVVRVNQEASLILEQPLIKVPFEQLRRHAKTQQKLIERDFTALQSSITDVLKNKRDAAQTTKTLDAMIARVEGLKRKLEDAQREVAPVQQSMRRRLTHLSELDGFQTTDSPGYAEWSERRLDRWLVDWNLRTGKEATAKTIARARGIEDLVEVDLFSSIHRIETALLRHSCAEALSWCSQNKQALAKLKSTLEFDLRRQEYVELARAGRATDAMAYAKKHFSAYLSTHSKEVTLCMGLLACGSDTTVTRYKRLYDPERWTALTRSFRTAAFTLYSLPTEPLLNLALYAGMASLKLPSCYDPDSRNLDCPICDSAGLGQLAKEVPWSHHVNSTIVCEISGAIMNEDNPPLVFPNGYVYSTEALKEMADRCNGEVTCPRSGYICDIKQLRKVYIT